MKIKFLKRIGCFFSLCVLALFIGAKTAEGATFTVNTTADDPDATVGDGICETAPGNGICTLRAAIAEANNTADADDINFIIAGSGVQTITLGGRLPNIVNPLTINGFTQPGASANTLAVGSDAQMRIVINGNDAIDYPLIIFTTNNVIIRGLVINNYIRVGILIYPSNNVVIEGCFIGTNADGTASGGARQESSITFIEGGTNNVIGGTTAASRNVISGNKGYAINSFEALRIQNNYIGTNAAGNAAIPNGPSVAAVYVGNGVIIGGKTATTRNVISGNIGSALEIAGSVPNGAANAVVVGNYIGLAADGVTALPNTSFIASNYQGNGIQMVNSLRNQIGDGTPEGANRIANNEGAGIVVNNFNGSADGNRISVNSIYNNGKLGIDLTNDVNKAGNGVTPNDFQDPDTGANGLQNFPVLTGVSSANGNTRVQGTLNSTPNRAFRLEFYNNATADSSTYGEGQIFIGAANVTTDANGDATFDQTFAFAAATNSFISSTATDTTDLNTSEFSRNSQILAPTAAFGSVSGRVQTAGGRGIRSVRVSLIQADGTTKFVTTTAFGYYRFDNVEVGQSIVVSVAGKRFRFTPGTQVINMTEDIANLDFTANDSLFY